MNNPPVVSRVHGSYDDYTLFRVAQGTAFITGAKGLYYNRNGFYSPTLCRFTTRDPNETALPIVVAIVTNGQLQPILAQVCDVSILYSSGLNLYTYERASAPNRLDPLGLLDDFSSAILGYYGERAAMSDYVYSSSTAGAMKCLRAAGIWAAIAGVTAINPAAGMVLTASIAAFGMYQDVDDLLINGWSWSTGARLLANGVSLGASSAALIGMRTAYLEGRAAYAASSSIGTIVRPTRRIYTARVLARSAEESGAFHNFPMSFDDLIIQQGRFIRNGDYVQYTYEGVIGGYTGYYQIGGSIGGAGNSTIFITHRFFSPG